MKPGVAISTTSQLAASVARQIAKSGGNAVDCAIAASICSINTEPGVCALAGSAYVTIWPAQGNAITIDGNAAIPGAGSGRTRFASDKPVYMDYGGGIETVVGPPSVAVPGTLAALEWASKKFGAIPWRELFVPTISVTRKGFPLSAACHYYLQYSGDVIFGRSEEGHQALHETDGSLKPVTSRIVVPGLADSLAAIAERGAAIFYTGDLGQKIAGHVQDRGGLLTRDDLKSYRPIIRDALLIRSGAWTVATNPPPAIGGAVLGAMLLSFSAAAAGGWTATSSNQLLRIQEAALSYRRKKLDLAGDIDAAAAELLRLAGNQDLLSRWASASTVHTSAVDESGLACAITASSGYGSGEMPAGTGLWLNNSLGELELNRHGLSATPPGRRLPSNMAPSAARSAKEIIAIGSPGADRITTALHQFLVNYLQLGMSLEEAIRHPRMHLALGDTESILAMEPGVLADDSPFPIRQYPDLNMYFGGVVAASNSASAGLQAAADPRREGGTYISRRSRRVNA